MANCKLKTLIRLWREILQKDSLLRILARFLHVETQEIKISTAKGIQYLLNNKQDSLSAIILSRFFFYDLESQTFVLPVTVLNTTIHAGSKNIRRT